MISILLSFWFNLDRFSRENTQFYLDTDPIREKFTTIYYNNNSLN